MALAQRPNGIVVEDAVARGEGLGVGVGVGDGDGDGFVAAGEPHAVRAATAKQRNRFINRI
jgi:hypothetical protein